MTTLANRPRPVNETIPDSLPWGFELLAIDFPETIDEDLRRFRAKHGHRFAAEFEARRLRENLPESLLYVAFETPAGTEYTPMVMMDYLPANAALYFMSMGNKPTFIAVPEPPAVARHARNVLAYAEAMRQAASRNAARRESLKSRSHGTSKALVYKRVIARQKIHYVELLPGEPHPRKTFARIGAGRGARYAEIAA